MFDMTKAIKATSTGVEEGDVPEWEAAACHLNHYGYALFNCIVIFTIIIIIPLMCSDSVLSCPVLL